MIRVKFYTEDGASRGFELMGHAGGGEYGQDVICAGVSALSINTVNALEVLVKEPMEVTADEREGGLLRVTFPGAASREAQLLVDALELGLESIRQEYGAKYIEIRK